MWGDTHCDGCGQPVPGPQSPPWFVCCGASACSCGRGLERVEFETALMELAEVVGWPYATMARCDDCRHCASAECPPLVDAVVTFVADGAGPGRDLIEGCGAFESLHTEG